MKVLHLTSRTDLERELPDTDIFVGVSLPAALLASARRLKWIHATAAGVSQLMYPELRASDVVVTCARGVNAITVAEHALALMLAVARRLPRAWAFQQQQRWAQQELWDDRVRPGELYGKTLLLVGLGAIGQQIALRARAFGMRLLAVTRTGQAPQGLVDRAAPPEALDELLPEADFLVLAAPETPQTRRLIDRERLARLPARSVVINLARGTLLDEAALVEALAQGRIAAAALDVTEREPLPADSPLWKIENLLLTPHSAALSERLWSRQAELLLENLRRWFAGEPLLNCVDKQRGY